MVQSAYLRALSFTPGFSPVAMALTLLRNRFNGFSYAPRLSTGLKPGVNKTSFEIMPAYSRAS